MALRTSPTPTAAPTAGSAAASAAQHPQTARQIWANIPKGLRDRVRPMLGQIIGEMIREIQRTVPAYAQPLEGKFGRVLVGSVERAVFLAFERVSDADTPQDDWEAWFRHAGQLEFLEGRTMDSLQTAVRVGARVCWRRLSTMGQQMGVPTDILVTLADAMFTYIDELSAVAIAGYGEAQAHAAGALERRRRQLMQLILADPPATPHAIAELAATTDWPLPEQVAVVAVEYRSDQHQLSPMSLSRHVLVDLESAEPCLIITDPERQIDQLAAELNCRRAAVGPMAPLADAGRSLAIARRALHLMQRGVLPGKPVTWCADHLTELVLLSDEFLVSQLTRQVLAPFEGLTDKQRRRLSSTMLAWLQTRGGVNEIAARLDVHPQTVRYRMRQLEELLGDRLSDPDQRLGMEIALRAQGLLAS